MPLRATGSSSITVHQSGSKGRGRRQPGTRMATILKTGRIMLRFLTAPIRLLWFVVRSIVKLVLWFPAKLWSVVLAFLKPVVWILAKLWSMLATLARGFLRLFNRLWQCVALPFRGLSNDSRRWLRRHRPTLIICGLAMLFLVVFFAPRILVRVAPGEAGVLYRLFGGGTVVDHVYGEGIHAIFPWNTFYIYNVRIQEREQVVELLTNEGLKLKFVLSIRYYPEYDFVGYLHKRVGPDYVEKVVVPQVVSVLRVYVGQFSAEEVYTTRRAILERIFSEAIEQVNQKFIKIDQVIIREIVLPPLVQQAVDEKIQQKHVAEAYEFRLRKEQQEAKRKEIEANGFAIYNDTIQKSLSPDILKWKGIEATREMATSPNSKVIVIGNGEDGLPIILGSGQ